MAHASLKLVFVQVAYMPQWLSAGVESSLPIAPKFGGKERLFITHLIGTKSF